MSAAIAASDLIFIMKVEGHRTVVMCDALKIGAIFPPMNPAGRVWRWRAWVTARANHVDGTAHSAVAAAQEVIDRFIIMAKLAGLVSS